MELLILTSMAGVGFLTFSGFMVSPAHGTVFRVYLLLFAAIVMIWSTLSALPQWDSMAIPILLPLGVSIFGSDASFLFQKVN